MIGGAEVRAEAISKVVYVLSSY